MANSPAPLPDQPLATFSSPAGSGGERPFEVRTPVARIGQGPQNDIVLDDDTVSTNHARLDFADGTWRLTDLESKNGTYVSGVRLAPHVPTTLTGRADVGFGAVKLQFNPNDRVEPAEVLAAARAETPRTTTVRRAGFRLPVWMLLLILLFIAALTFLFFWFGGATQPVDPILDPVSIMTVELAPAETATVRLVA